MDSHINNEYVCILKKELIPALGCTEPIAIAYASASAAKALGEKPVCMSIDCSGNLIKNAKSVDIPNSNGLKGIEAAATLGAIGGDAGRKLEVLTSVTEDSLAESRRLIAEGFCKCGLAEGVAGLYIKIAMKGEHHSVKLELSGGHTDIVSIVKDGEEIFAAGLGAKAADISGAEAAEKSAAAAPDYTLLNVADILAFADSADLEELRELLTYQAECNYALAEAGLKEKYGAEVGRTILETRAGTDDDVITAYTAAGADARMNGCPLPAVINSGSGNQGITVSVPVIKYCELKGIDKEKMLRGLIVSNLISIYQKYYIGNLSAYCGAVSASCGAACGIMYVSGAGREEIEAVIRNTIATTGGMICDGAKASCASKIAAGLSAALLSIQMAKKGRSLKGGDGVVLDTADDTIKGLGYIAKHGMNQTDIDVLSIMLNKVAL